MIELRPEVDLPKALNLLAFGPERERPTRGGSTSVTYKDTDRMANLDNCWCGQRVDHDWPGKDDGAPHPRYPQ